jgi:hypothetical protein
MNVRIDAARDHNLPGGVDDPRSADVREVGGRDDRDDLAVIDPDIGGLGAVWQNRHAAANRSFRLCEHASH